MTGPCKKAVTAFAAAVLCAAVPAQQPEIKVGSKEFTEGEILGEIAAHLARAAGAKATNRVLGGTRVLWEALLLGEIDIYPEYTGTVSEEILKARGVRGEDAIRKAIAEKGIRMSRPLGFNNTYAVGMRRGVAEKYGIAKISDLTKQTDFAFGFSNEFMDRADGWPALRNRYRLPQRNVRGMQHDLAYPALQSGAIQATDLYSTDAKIKLYDLLVLEDDLGHFPTYNAVWLYRADLQERSPEVVAQLLKAEGRITEGEMIAMNARAEVNKLPASRVAADFVNKKLALDAEAEVETTAGRIWKHTGEHLRLVFSSLIAAILVSIPLGVLAAKQPTLGQLILGVAGIIQTIPALALLVMLIRPLGSIGFWPAVVALFLYSLLPIIRNTYTGLLDIPPQIRESAAALGLSSQARLWLVELPMASRLILAGVKTAAVINVGFATLGALIGAGGYGQPILTGIRLLDYGLMLEGALPAAALALLVQGVFELSERVFVPKGLRLKAERA